MEVIFEEKSYIVPGCCNLIKDGDQKEPHCGKRFDCNKLGVCIWAAEGRRGPHVIDKMPDTRQVG